jgi:hypothetical protein
MYSQYFTFSTSSCSCSQSTLKTITQLWHWLKDCCCVMINECCSLCVCVCVCVSVHICATSSSAHLTSPCWSVSLTPEDNSPLHSAFHKYKSHLSLKWKPIFTADMFLLLNLLSKCISWPSPTPVSFTKTINW